MPLIIVIVLLSLLKYLDIGPFTTMSWWWIVGLVGIAFIWFEFVERAVGMDKRRAHEQLEKMRQERVKRAFDKRNRSRRRQRRR